MSEPDADSYALKSTALAEVPAPDLPYQPPMPRAYRPRIGVSHKRFTPSSAR